MNHKIMIIALIICFSAVNGFSSPKNEVDKNEVKKNEVNVNEETIKKINSNIDELKEALKKPQEDIKKAIKELKGETSASVFTQTNVPSRLNNKNLDSKLVPLTWETAKLFGDELYKLDFYINKNLNLTAKEQNNNQGFAKDGKNLENSEKNPPEEKLSINNNTPVKVLNFYINSKNQETIVVYISSQSALLKFRRNTRDCFQLESVKKKKISFPFDEEVLLCFHDEKSRNKLTSIQTGTS